MSGYWFGVALALGGIVAIGLVSTSGASAILFLVGVFLLLLGGIIITADLKI